MEKISRKYNSKDVDMLSVSAVIIENAIKHKTFLISKRSTWADPFFPNLLTRINSAFPDYLGIDNAKEMRDATQVVINMQALSLTLLSEFKIQIVEDFKNANITQETFKGGRKEITQEAVTEFNEIYSEVISVARISARFLKKDPALRDKFSYTKTLNGLNKPKTEKTPS